MIIKRHHGYNGQTLPYLFVQKITAADRFSDRLLAPTGLMLWESHARSFSRENKNQEIVLDSDYVNC